MRAGTAFLHLFGRELASLLSLEDIRRFRQVNRAIRNAFQWNSIGSICSLDDIDPISIREGVWIYMGIRIFEMEDNRQWSIDQRVLLVERDDIQQKFKVLVENPQFMESYVYSRNLSSDTPLTAVWLPSAEIGDVGVYGNTTWRKPSFYKARWNFYVRRSECHMEFPVWKSDNLGVSESVKERLLDNITQCDIVRNDVQSNGVVHDIVDCDWMPQYFPDISKEWLMAKMQSRHNYLKNDDSWKENITPYMLIREEYHWKASYVRIDERGRAKFLTPVHNLPVDGEYAFMTQDLEHVLTKMVPMFRETGVINPETQSNLQFVIKIQEYVVPPGTSYTGKWHTEGYTENIAAAGVYYLRVDSEMEGGDLKFRPSHSPDKGNFDKSAILSVQEGSCFVFSNLIPHRFTKMTNATTTPLKRTFINFFLVNPKIPLPEPTSINQRIELDGREYEYARRRREVARDAMVNIKTSWGIYNWGNYGSVEFIDPLTIQSYHEDVQLLDKVSDDSE